jgi:hypothetical protein
MKANKRALLEGNFWDLRWVHGRLAGKPQVDADDTKARHQKKKDRIRKERRRVNLYNCLSVGASLWIDKQQHRDKRQTKHNQIQYGFDLAEHWMIQHA